MSKKNQSARQSGSKSKRPVFKHVLGSPFTLECNPLSVEDSTEILQSIQTEMNGVSDKTTSLVIGINAVSRCLEKDPPEMVIATSSIKPLTLLTHVRTLCFIKKVPLCMLSCPSSEMGTCFGVKRASVIAFRKDSPFVHVVDEIKTRKDVSIPDIPWLSDINKDALAALNVVQVLPKRKAKETLDTSNPQPLTKQIVLEKES